MSKADNYQALEKDRVCRQGTQAWRRLKKEKSWGDWITVGQALQVGRDWAMSQAQTNKPEGKGYNLCFGEWLIKYKLDDMDKGDRARLFEVMDNLGMIQDWRRTLPLNVRLSLNHPNSVLRKFKRAIEPEDKTVEPKPTLRDSVVNLSEENHAQELLITELKNRIKELEEELAGVRQDRDHWRAVANPQLQN